MALRTRPPPWSPTASREEGRAYLQDRLALFTTVMLVIFVLLMGVTFWMYEEYRETLPGNRHWIPDVYGLVGIAIIAASRILLARRALSIELLYVIDTIYAVGVGVAFGLSGYYKADESVQVYGAFLWHTFMVSSRAIIVPSSPRRTAVVSAASFVPLLVAAVATATYSSFQVAPGLFVFVTALSAVTAVALATMGSHVIYGLHRKVSEARQLGQYTLAEKIGEGGMGTVYRARHAMLRRPTAVKLLPPDRHDADEIARFEREVQHMSRLTHPNTVAVYDYGRSPEGMFYYAMEYLDGVDLDTLVRRDGPQPAARVIRILRQVCGALEEAHGVGLIHRDIKPANIILCRRGITPDVAKVVDFGLVMEHRDGPSQQAIVGTPAYLAPEAVTDPSQVGPATDLYAVGATGYFLLTGFPVFDGKTVVELCVQHATDEPVPPSQRTSNPIPEGLEDLILACLSKSPSRRPASAAALRAALAALPEGRDWDEARARGWWEAQASVRRTTAAVSARTPLTMTVDLGGRTPEA